MAKKKKAKKKAPAVTSKEPEVVLYQAIDSGDLQALRKALDEAPHLLNEGWRGEGSPSYLHLASRKGRIEVCRELVEQGLDINVPDFFDGHHVPLGVAAGKGHLELCEWFLRNGAFVDGHPNTVSSPLIEASVAGFLDVVKLLLKHGADINRRNPVFNETVLDLTLAFARKATGQVAVAEFLRKEGAVSARGSRARSSKTKK